MSKPNEKHGATPRPAANGRKPMPNANPQKQDTNKETKSFKARSQELVQKKQAPNTSTTNKNTPTQASNNKNPKQSRRNNTARKSKTRSNSPTWAKDSDIRHKNQQTPERATEPVMSPQLQFKKGRPGNPSHRGTNIRQANENIIKNSKQLATDTLKIIPIGGLLEIGKNMTVFEFGNDMIIVDVGVLFPDDYQPGIDAVIPDFSYVKNNLEKLRGIYITHGHEDHIGSLPYLMQEIKVNVPIYAGKLAAELIKTKYEDRGIRQFAKQVYAVEPGHTRKTGCFEVEFINVNHSIADAFALAISTPAGVVVHSGDFKVDYTPVNGKPIDLARLARLGEEGVLVYLGESTNVSREGFTMSERTVGETFAKHFAEARGRIFVATFSSNVSRVQQIINAAEEVGRKVALVGRSMLNVFNAANRLGYIKMKENTLIELNEVNRFKAEEICIISTGSQGEPMSALTRMAYAEHRSIDIQESDTVIISATAIPGNEKPILRVIDELYKRGAKVVYSDISAIHVSGHANREEHKLMHTLLKPQYFIPVHGEYRMLFNHGALAHELGMPWNNIFVLNNGDIFECNAKEASIAGYTEADAVLIDGTSMTSNDSMALQQRKELSSDGVLSVAILLNKQNQVEGKPAVLSYGALVDFSENYSEANDSIAKFVIDYVKRNQAEGNKMASNLRSRHFRLQLQNFFYGNTGRRPITLVSVIER